MVTYGNILINLARTNNTEKHNEKCRQYHNDQIQGKRKN
jgi:hypothetical protein